MKYRPLGKTGVQVSEIGLGCGGRIGFSDFSERQAERLLHAAVDLGITFFDTGSNYSLGNSERRLGRFLKPHRAKIILATKCGSRVVAGPDGEPSMKRDFTYDGLIGCLKESLTRLQTGHVDLIQLHTPPADAVKPGSDAVRALLEMKKEGLTRLIGVSADGDRALQAISLNIFDTLQTTYNVVMQEAAQKVLPAALNAGMGVIVKEPAANAFFLDKPKPDEDYAYQLPCWERAQHFKYLAEWTSPAPVQAALKFVLENKAVSTAIGATTNEDHLKSNVQASALKALDPLLRNRLLQTFGELSAAG